MTSIREYHKGKNNEFYQVDDIGIIRPDDIFNFVDNPKIIYIAFMGQDKDGKDQLCKRIIYHFGLNGAKQVSKASKMPTKGVCKILLNPRKAKLFEVKKGRKFVLLRYKRHEAKFKPVARVHKTSKTTDAWDIELFHCDEEFVKISIHADVIPL